MTLQIYTIFCYLFHTVIYLTLYLWLFYNMGTRIKGKGGKVKVGKDKG